jgi:hypothetical protein
VVFHHVLARRDSLATEPEDAPHGNRVAVFSTWDDEARCIGILGFWRSQSIEAWMAKDKSVYDDEAAALAMRCAAPNEPSLIIASMLANNPGFRAVGSRVLVAGWADPSLHVDVELPDDQGTEKSRAATQTTGYRSSASGHFSLSVLRLPDATESITVSVGPESTFPLSLEPLVRVNNAP